MAEKNLGAIEEQELKEISEGEASNAGGIAIPTIGPTPSVLITKILCPSVLLCR